MNFVHPWFLTALTALAIPVIIHLFSFRRYKRVYFPNVRFLRELKEETHSYQRLKHLLILLMRLLALTFLVLAFAQPYIPVEKKAGTMVGTKTIHLFVDNSFSMQSLGKSSNILEEAKRNATDIVKSFKESDQFQLLTNDFEGRHQRYYTRDEMLNLINEVDISPVSKSASEILKRHNDLIHAKKSTNASIFILSDFQRSTFSPEQFKTDTSVSINLIPIQPEAVRNIYIDSLWFKDPVRRPGKREELFISIKNSSSENLESVPVKLFINGLQKGLTSINLEAGEVKDTVISFVANDKGIQQGRVTLTDYPVSFDDAFYFSYSIPEVINILIINGKDENPFLNSLLANDSTFHLTNTPENRIDYSSLPQNQLVILNEVPKLSSGLNEELTKFMNNGGSVLVLPTEKEIEGYNEFLNQFAIRIDGPDTSKTTVQQLFEDHPLFAGVFEKKPENVDLPEVKNRFRITPGTRSQFEYLMRLPDGLPFLGVRPVGKGKLYLSASSFNESASSFVKHALFVPVAYNIALFSTPSSDLYYTIGKEQRINTSARSLAAEQVYRIKADTGSYESIPEVRRTSGDMTLFMHNSVLQAGNYNLLLGNERIQGLSFNFDRKESEMTYYEADELKESINDPNINILDISDGKASIAIEELSEGRKLWKLCIILALLFVLAEILIIKFWKNEAPLKVSTDR